MTKISPRLARAVAELVDVSEKAGHFPRLTAAGSEALKNEVLDKFASGDYQGGLTALLGSTRSTRAKRAVTDLAASALVALGIDVNQAKESLSIALTQLAKGGETIPSAPLPDLRTSPIRGAFRGIGFDFGERTQLTLKQHAAQNARLEASLVEALAAPNRNEALVALEKKLDLAKTPDAILMGMLTAHREDEKWADVIRLYEASPAAFREIPYAKREHALALAQTGNNHDAREELSTLIKGGDRTNVTLGMYGRILKDRSDRAQKEGDPKKAAMYLDMSLSSYRMGFRAEHGALYPGVAMPALLEQKGTPESIAEAKVIAKVVLYNAERRSRFGENNYFDSAAALEMCCVLGDSVGIKKWMNQTVAASSEHWMRQSTVKNLERLATVRGAKASPELLDTIKQLSAIPPNARKVIPRGISNFDAPNPKEQVMAALSEQTYRVGGRSSKWLSGNYAYSGIAHDVRITPADVIYFKRVLRAAGIHNIEKPLEAIKAMDKLIREHFGTDKLENLKSPEHQRYDRVMPGLAKFMSATRENSQTNASADWINGLADCRQHAPAKLMLWEAWKRSRTEDLLERFTRATTDGNTGAANHAREALDRLWPWEMRVLDGRVLDAKDGSFKEEHTMTILVKRGASSEGGPLANAEEVRLADSFYQNVYPFGEGLLKVELDGKKLRLIPPGEASVVIEPAPYSSDRSSRSLDFGQLLFRGQSVANPGWERDVPVGGLDLKPLHDYVDQQALAAIEAAKPKSILSA